MQKPKILSIKTSKELLNWYWKKEELVSLAKKLKISSTGGKFELQAKIAYYFDHKTILKPQKEKTTSKFNWAKEELKLNTVITDNYKNGPNVRNFLKKHIGGSFKFNMDFMNWMKQNVGKTLQDAIDYYNKREQLIKVGQYRQEIPDHNQFNAYTRDYFLDNPNGTLEEVRKLWEIRISQPGANRLSYSKKDLQLLK